MDVRVDSARSNDAVFACNHICAGSHDQVAVDAVHDVRVACLADANDDTVLDSDICLDDARPVDDERIGDDRVQHVVVGTPAGLTHSFSQCLAAAECALVAISRHVLLHLDPQIGGA